MKMYLVLGAVGFVVAATAIPVEAPAFRMYCADNTVEQIWECTLGSAQSEQNWYECTPNAEDPPTEYECVSQTSLGVTGGWTMLFEGTEYNVDLLVCAHLNNVPLVCEFVWGVDPPDQYVCTEVTGGTNSCITIE